MSPCNWCGDDEVEKVPGKLYCVECNMHKYKECISCHKPYPTSNAFLNHEERCNSCHKKYQNNILKRKNTKKLNEVKNKVFKTEDSDEDEDEDDDDDDVDVDEKRSLEKDIINSTVKPIKQHIKTDPYKTKKIDVEDVKEMLQKDKDKKNTKKTKSENKADTYAKLIKSFVDYISKCNT